MVNKYPEYTLTAKQKIHIKVGGMVFVGKHKREGWRIALPFYALWCPEHGIVLDYPHGYSDRLDCTQCVEKKK